MVYSFDEIKEKVRVDRQSVCMGDDCTAPNEKLLAVEEKDRLSDMLYKVACYLPQMRDAVWAVDSGIKVLGYVLMDSGISEK